MFIETYIAETIDRLGRVHKRIMGRCTCTLCGKEFVRGNYNWDICINDPTRPTFCSTKCSRSARRKNGISDERLRNKNLERYGIEHTLQRPDVRTRSKQTWIDKYGVDNPLKDTGIRNRAQATVQKKYGVNSAFHIPANVAKLDYNIIVAKQIATMKKNKTFQSSKQENQFYELLMSKYPDTKRQVLAPETHWVIDFYVSSIDTWIQIDGVYWHGLNRTIDEIKKAGGFRDQKILRTIENDKRQNEWFAAHNMKLLRFTDKEVIAMTALPTFLTSLSNQQLQDAHR